MTKQENEERLARLKNIVLSMPEKPGSYQYYDENHTIIYVLLKDGKTYPSICVTNEYFPRIFKTRHINKKVGTFFGPYPHIGSMYAVLEVIKKLYKPRTCRFPITKEGIAEGKYKPCLEYHIHNCGAPCINKQSYEEYQENMRQAREILKGNTREVSKYLYDLMMKNAELLKFEVAEEYKRKYQLLDEFEAKSEVVSHTITDVDVFTLVNDDANKNAFINYIHVKNGTINQSFTYEYKRKLEESDEELLITAIPEIRERFHSTSKEIIVPFEMDWKLKDATFFVPQRGDKKHLLDLSEMNGKQYKFDRLKQADKLNPEQKQTRLMKELQAKLKLPKLPYQIECFDNSNISGTDAVAGCIVYKGMKPSRKDYRKYNIKTVEGPDDYASMQEVVRRRYSRMIEEETPLPDLIITDGGKGQMDVVREVIVDELHLDIPIAGLAKDDRHRTNELLYGFPPQTVALPPESELFKVLTQIQDEVHRYAITFHRDKRSKHALHSELDDIKGIGPKAKEALLSKFKSVKKMKEASLEALTEVLGPHKAELLNAYFQQKEENFPSEEK